MKVKQQTNDKQIDIKNKNKSVVFLRNFIENDKVIWDIKYRILYI